jgi:hypothetical protein
MNREIKFRVWDVIGKKMFIPKSIENNSICSIPEDDDEQFYVHMQFTGLKDFFAWKEFIYDEAYEIPEIRGSGWRDFGFEILGTLVGLIFTYLFFKIK